MQTRRFKPQGIALALAVFGIAAAATAHQATTGGHADASFESLDKNHDGRLARSEIPSDMPLLRTRLATYDSDHDGSLDASEFAAAQAALHGTDRTGEGDDDAASQRQPPPDPADG